MKEKILELKELLGDDFGILVEAYDVDNRKVLIDVEKHLSNQDAQQVANSIHSIKGASANLGAVELTQLCQAMEQSARGGDLSGAEEQLVTIKQLFEEAVTILKSV
ncbi:Hpt domain-containing protein [Pleionea sp. CnH1-48]|uniref:Hpt domain-containing protein n=1 Tax=Pleionea sp. CnH1-48 TaxID=2954494 RepID=UPI00209782B0|nr:Hpt domain-containing protein [Pleionea sp. CnH1-48]MCO7226111.1 Hpt domain-containing protein [Pleionea sp. CnH1-48]